MHRPATTLLAATVLALGAVACSSGDATEASSATTPGPSTRVEIDDFAFDPDTVTVEVGTTVTWSNEDATNHTVTAGSEDDPLPEAFDLVVEEQGETVSTTFDEPGTYAYYCAVHPFMTGTIEVTG